MIEYEHLLGRPFMLGTQDCFSVVRDFYISNFGITLPNYARPKEFWKHGLEMYRDRYHQNGFVEVDCHPSQYQIGDVFVMSIRATVGNHAGVLVEKGRMLHHFTGRLSEVVPYRDLWRNSTVGVFRHKDVEIEEQTQVVNIVDHLPPNIRRKIDDLEQTP